ncbi:hypothetical protein [Levilactobacillus lindianensis]|uniref:hypothetical protein n=1 Tax=Levilactobacillus lindianensis TaxID=2486018 RepID=UPI0013DE3A02|nr:hypothetical protein [Levilactobacillus lindianensis]
MKDSGLVRIKLVICHNEKLLCIIEDKLTAYANASGTTFSVVNDYPRDEFRMALHVIDDRIRINADRVKVQTGIMVINSELSEGPIRFKMTYQMNYGTYHVNLIGEELLSVWHTWKEVRTRKEMDKLSHYEDKSNLINQYIGRMQVTMNADENFRKQLFRRLSHVGKNTSSAIRLDLKKLQTDLSLPITRLALLAKIEGIFKKYSLTDCRAVQESLNRFLMQMTKSHGN